MPLTIKVRKDGPYAVDLATGDFTLIAHDGNVIPLPELKPGKTTGRYAFPLARHQSRS